MSILEPLIVLGCLTFSGQTPPTNTCLQQQIIQEQKIEYQREQEKIEYKTKNHNVIKQIPSKLGYNCVQYAKSKRAIGTGYGNLAQKVGKIKTKTPSVHAIGVTSEGWAGHLVYIEEVKEKTLIISEGNYHHGFITWREVPKTLIIGYL